jgi:hypothetical protein
MGIIVVAESRSISRTRIGKPPTHPGSRYTVQAHPPFPISVWLLSLLWVPAKAQIEFEVYIVVVRRNHLNRGA